MREFGLAVEYDGKRYTALSDAGVREYAVGEMVCELLRFHAYELKDLIVQAPYFYDPLDADKMVEAIFWLRDRLREKYPFVVAEMFTNDFANKNLEYFTIVEEDRHRWIEGYNQAAADNEVMEFVLKDTGYEQLGAKTNGQFLLSLYCWVSYEYCIFASGFMAYLDDNDDDPTVSERFNGLLSMYNDEHDFMDIDFRIKIYEGGLHSLFIIKSFMSLALFELAHLFEHGIEIIKCKNCGHYFVPLKRTDTKYCNYPAPDCPDKTCKEVGAQKAWANKEKVDDVTQAYRKVYMRYKMRANRHPDDTEAQETMTRLSEGIREWRRKLEAGEAEKDEFMRWLEEFSRNNSEDGDGKDGGDSA